MDWKQVPDFEFRILETNGGHYRVPVILKDSPLHFLLNWKPTGKNKQTNPKLTELDEPMSTDCDVDNPFAGICDDAE